MTYISSFVRRHCSFRRCLVWLATLCLLFCLFLVYKKYKTCNPASMRNMWSCREYQSNGLPSGGFLSHMISSERIDGILKRGNLKLSDCADCSGRAQTCSAWTFMRDDLIPMLFIYPSSPWSSDDKASPAPRVGFLVDARKFSTLITNMAIIDGASDDRNACSETRGTWEILAEHDTKAGRKVLISPPDEIANATVGNRYDPIAKLLKSGGGPTRWMIANKLRSPDCGNIVDKATESEIKSFLTYTNDTNDTQKYSSSSDDFYIIRWSNVDCSLCDKPFLCKLDGPPQIVETDDVTWAMVGDRGQHWTSMFGGPLHVAQTMNGQCKWLPKNWKTWVEVMKKYYIDHASQRDAAAWKNSYLNSSPCTTFLYLENEANIFVDDRPEKMRQQDKLLRDSLLGVFFVDSTCEQQLMDLGTGVACGSAGSSCVSFCEGPGGDGEVQHFLDEKDRCKRYMCGAHKTGDTCDAFAWEQKQIEGAKKQAAQLVDLLNSQNGPVVKLLRCKALSPTFVNSSKVGMSFGFDDVFQIIA